MPHVSPKLKSLIDLTDDELVKNRERTFIEDAEWRDKYVDFDKAIALYERTSDDTDEEGLPWQNLVRRAVEDFVAVATANIPDARLIATRFLDDPELADMVEASELFATMITDLFDKAEENLNSFVKTILIESDFADEVEKAVTQSAVCGVGYLETYVDNSADTRFSPELKDLFNKDFSRWTERDISRLNMLTNRISVRFRDSRDVYFQNGVRRFDERMQRVSYVDRFDTESLRAIHGNPNIQPGRAPHHVEEDLDAEDPNSITAQITTYELVPVIREKGIIDVEASGLAPGEEPEEVEFMDAEGVRMRITDWVMVKTVIAGGELLEREHINEDERGSISLPIVPFYLRESERHPYGFSIVLMLQLAERFINRIRVLIYQSALNAISPQAMVGMVKGMGPDDEQRIKDVLNTGGFANIVGNDYEGETKISEVVQQVIRSNPGVPTALVQAMQNEERAFSSQAQSLDLAQIARAESGSAKRAQIAVADRPKTITLNLLSKSIETVYDNLFDLIQNTFTDEVPVSILSPEGQRDTITLNEQLDEALPILNDQGEPETDEQGEPIYAAFNFKINDTSIRMKAQAEGRGRLPTDLPSRIVLVSQLMEMGLFKSIQTPRDLLLDTALKAKDDRNVSADMQQAAQQAGGVLPGQPGPVGDVLSDEAAAQADAQSQASLFESSPLVQETQDVTEQ